MSNRRPRYLSLVRCLQLAVRLQGRRRLPPLPELARELGVCGRTVRRYLEALEEARWPIPLRDRESE